ncbi:MAG: hypothetical protein Kow0069_22910 [Promethearchaeota archaeon]
MNNVSEKIETLEQAFSAIKARYTDNEKVRKKFKKWDKPIQLNFTDTGKHFQIQINFDQGIDVVEANDPDCEIQVHFDTETLLAILNKELGGVKAYSSGKIKVDGKITQLLKLKALMF